MRFKEGDVVQFVRKTPGWENRYVERIGDLFIFDSYSYKNGQLVCHVRVGDNKTHTKWFFENDLDLTYFRQGTFDGIKDKRILVSNGSGRWDVVERVEFNGFDNIPTKKKSSLRSVFWAKRMSRKNKETEE